VAFDSQRAPAWVGLWQERWWQIALLTAALTLLTLIFIRQKTLTRYPKLLHRLRWMFLLFTLLFIGWYAQGQLSVVNIYTLLLALRDGFSLNVFLLDPVIFILWSYTFMTLFIWGRGVFCGWLCPFGALQEATAWLGQKLGLKQIKIAYKWHRRLILLKYPVLLAIVAAAFFSLTLAESLAEAEPFKTAITLYFRLSCMHWVCLQRACSCINFIVDIYAPWVPGLPYWVDFACSAGLIELNAAANPVSTVVTAAALMPFARMGESIMTSASNVLSVSLSCATPISAWITLFGTDSSESGHIFWPRMQLDAASVT
jgi:hypothetical protein